MAMSSCSVCAIAGVGATSELGNTAWARSIGVNEASVRRHLKHIVKHVSNGPQATEESSDGSKAVTAIRDRPVTLADAREWITSSGDNPDNYNLSIRAIAYGETLFSNRMSATPKNAKSADGGPAWPVIQPAQPVIVEGQKWKPSVYPKDRRQQLAIKCADTQIGFRILPDGTIDPFHDDRAMALFVRVCAEYQPDKIQILGDFLDLAAQGRFAQEAAFANTTQLAIDRGHLFLAELRAAAPTAEIILIEGNHDLRMQRFIETNALAAFGLKQANTPDAWPVMSLPFLLRLAELNVRYVDAYPAATDWDNDNTRNIHGTRANSKGSTMSQYVHELPHISTWAGHTHRAEIVYRTVLGARGEPIESYAANPGVLCRTDGAVPSVHGALGASGVPERIVEDWQQGFGMLYYTETESWPQVYRIKNGQTIIGDRVLSAA
jgi:hypothetical protein